MRTFDHVVIGHGLAGAAVAWWLRWQGRRVLVVDRDDPAGASRVAAGLLTPITGRRLATTWRLAELFPAAVAFYRRVEAETAASFFTTRRMVRLFVDAAERARFEEREQAARRALIRRPDSLVNSAWFAAPHGGFEMASAARLDLPRYLDASRARFAADEAFLAVAIDPARDLVLTPGGVTLPTLGIRAAGVIFCQGLAARDNPWFPDLRFTPAKGEVLTVRVPGLSEDRVVHRGVWLAPVGGDLFRAGATYDRDDPDTSPTERGRQHLCEQLREGLRLPFEVIGHAAGVRPIVAGGKPVLGVHPVHSQLAFLNGLGSKGALLAPFFAAQLVDHLAAARPIAPVEPRPIGPENPQRITEQSHAAVRAVLGPGELAVDATAGNGRDTVFLAGVVGPGGRVFAFDVQPLALDRTAARLKEVGFETVTLVCRDHAELVDVLPAEDRGRIGAVMFNLGGLSAGARPPVTRPAATATAVRAATSLLRPGGILTFVVYPAQPAGAAATAAIRQLLTSLTAAQFDLRESGPDRAVAPRLFVVRKRDSGHGSNPVHPAPAR